MIIMGMCQEDGNRFESLTRNLLGKKRTVIGGVDDKCLGS